MSLKERARRAEKRHERGELLTLSEWGLLNFDLNDLDDRDDDGAEE